MRTKVSFSWQALAVALTAVGMVSCSDTKNVMTDMPVIAERVQLPTGDLIACDLSKANDTVDVPLSLLTEELQVVKLDNRDEALVGGWVRTTVSDNYILVSNNKQVPYKLFKRNGEFVCSIGSYGQGPDEYILNSATLL